MLLGLNFEVEGKEMNLKMGDTKSPQSVGRGRERGGKWGQGWEIKECGAMSLKNKNESRNKTAMPNQRQE